MNRKINKYFFLFFLFVFGYGTLNSETHPAPGKIYPPDYGVCIGAFPDMGSTEDSVSFARLKAYENLTGQKPVWVYFSNNWFGKIKFPEREVKIIDNFGSIPFIRLMPRSDFNENKSDPVYSLQKIINGNFDDELLKWADDAKKFGKPMMLEFGLEMNGNWFSWSGLYNGKDPEVFKNAYRHIIDIFRNRQADNITWAYHVNSGSDPDEPWNSVSSYYPGDEYIDWIGMSIYGAQTPKDDWINVNDIFDDAYKRLSEISPNKPLAIFEFGTTENRRKPEWIKTFFELLKSEKYSRIKAVSYWHSRWENEDGSITNMRLDSSPEALEEYTKAISDNFFKAKLKLK